MAKLQPGTLSIYLQDFPSFRIVLVGHNYTFPTADSIAGTLLFKNTDMDPNSDVSHYSQNWSPQRVQLSNKMVLRLSSRPGYRLKSFLRDVLTSSPWIPSF